MGIKSRIYKCLIYMNHPIENVITELLFISTKTKEQFGLEEIYDDEDLWGE